MTDYIKREDAYSACCYETPECYMARKEIKALPSADVVEVVRCKDCKYWTEWANGTGSCSRFALDWIGTDADDFCSMAERKDNED